MVFSFCEKETITNGAHHVLPYVSRFLEVMDLGDQNLAQGMRLGQENLLPIEERSVPNQPVIGNGGHPFSLWHTRRLSKNPPELAMPE